MRNLFAALIASAMFTSPAMAKCLDRDAACEIELGEYHVLAPEGPADDTRPAVVFLHGYGNHGGNTINNVALIEPMLVRGYVVIAPTGLPRENGPGSRWSFLPEDDRRNELAFINAVLEDVQAKAPFDRSRVLLAGFSEGAFQTSYIACETPEEFAAYAPLAGGFWRPHPDNCAGPVRLLQTHGWSDGTVPIEGRPLAGGKFLQGDIFQTLQIWRDANSCDQMRADERTTDGPFWLRTWTHCAPGSALQFALHEGGHALPEGWSDFALDWFERLSTSEVSQ
ncbi:Phospholipase/Carboxylesterase [Roseovarius albus]|uniref:Phospholipase/Carboxylesterase n=1 Tax=Roseovarius albus TaxID=1247867 RepID=A0A1X6YLU6_9RHOB|nr:PHB depolymerase family esterase [Roseovarius albus]SLN25015.1 Phospholipase/Carboxylesterase [Roseovarius albus]